jgi:nitric oxide reductase NorD protein
MAENADEPNNPKKQTLTGLARRLSRLPSEHKRVALEASASLAGVSLRVSREFVEAVPKASRILSAEDLRQWSEMGRRLAMADIESGVKFFAHGVSDFKKVPENARPLVFQICTRQLVLSSSIAFETFESIPDLANKVCDDELLTDVLKLALEIAQRSAKHSADFLKSTPKVTEKLKAFVDKKAEVSKSVIDFASRFASRTGGMTADLWQTLPEVLEKVSAENVVRLMERAADFLEYGGSVSLHFVMSGGEVLRRVDAVFADWCELLKKVATHGNAVLISFIRSSPKFFANVVSLRKPDEIISISRRVLQLVREIAETDAESALAAFRSSTFALRKVSLIQFEDWIRSGLNGNSDNARARRAYFALETRQSNDFLQEGQEGLPLEKVRNILRIYIEGLTGKEVEISTLSAMPQESRINDGKTIYLPATVAEFKTDEQDFRLYKVLAAHGAGQIEFGTYEKDSVKLKEVFTSLTDLYEATAEQTDAFSLSGYIEDVQKGEKALSEEETAKVLNKAKKKLPKNSDYRNVLQIFPEPFLAKKIFGTLENARIDRRLRLEYRGLVRDLDLMQKNLREKRPFIFDLPIAQVPAELLFQITLCGGATEDSRRFYGQIVSEIESVIEVYLNDKTAAVADTLMATSRVYSLFQNIVSEQQSKEEQPNEDEKDEFEYENKNSDESAIEDKKKRDDRPQKKQDARDLFSAWNDLDEEGEPEDLQGAEAWTQNEIPEQPLESGDEAFAYDEWDRDLNDYRIGWSRVIEKKVRQGDRTFVELTRSRYRGVISSVRHQFQLMKPENLTRINREIDGEDYDLNALVEYVVDKKATGQASGRLYTKRLRKQRDVAVSLLLDQSSSTARTITRNPLQPYTFPGRRIIEIEKEGLVLMSEALEAVGDVYSINGFTSEGRRNVKFYVVKDFNEKYSEEVEKRIGGITFQNNTRMGAAIRHAAAKLARQESRTKLMIILTDGRPYDHDYGDARYAREDVREALTEAKLNGITPFCITIDRESEAELKDLYGDVGYTIIDDVLSLPERMPNIYRRLTS